MAHRKKLALITIALLLLSACGSTNKAADTSSAAATSEGVFVSGCGYGYSQKPSSITLTCADGGMYVSDITYSSWSETSAEGQGMFSMNDCNPDCADGNMINTPVTISLGKPKQDSQGKFIFSELIINSKTKLYNGSKSAVFDIFMEPEGATDWSATD